MGGRVAAAEANHHELPRRCADQEAAAGAGQCGEKADDEGAGNIDEHRAPGKHFPDAVRDDPRKPIARGAAKRAPQHDP